MSPWKVDAFAERIRRLIREHDGGDLDAAANRLGVSRADLAALVEQRGGELNLAVLGAVIREYNVDACWLLTGESDLTSERLDRETRARATEVLYRLSDDLSRRAKPPRE